MYFFVSTASHPIKFKKADVDVGYGPSISDCSAENYAITDLTFKSISSQSPDADRANVVAVVHPNSNHNMATYAASNFVLDPLFPAMEPAPIEYTNELFGRRFGVLHHNETTFSASRLSDFDLLNFYSVPIDISKNDTATHSSSRLLDDNLCYCIPFKFRAVITNQLIDHVGMSDDITYGNSEAVDNFQCYMTSASPTALDWTGAYNADSSTAAIVKCLRLDLKHS